MFLTTLSSQREAFTDMAEPANHDTTMSLRGFSSGVDGAKEKAVRDDDVRNEATQKGSHKKIQDTRQQQAHVKLVEKVDEGDSQVELRTPPTMERNLFLSALANGRLAVSKKCLTLLYRITRKSTPSTPRVCQNYVSTLPDE